VGFCISGVQKCLTSQSSRTNNSWFFARASLILTNYHLPLIGALYAATSFIFLFCGLGVLSKKLRLFHFFFMVTLVQ